MSDCEYCGTCHGTNIGCIDCAAAEVQNARMAGPLANLERALGLHERLEANYVVDGYTVELQGDDGDTVLYEATAPTLAEAFFALAKQLPER